ncbi:MAG: enoyl-CoA hydratase/carnithine racemase [Candidatus Krumholzibacteriia bacterium]|jgi:enoyl-CoA hydratase/carnithine racemase
MNYHNFDCEIAEGCANVSLVGPGAPHLADFHDEFVDLMLRLQEDRAVRVILFTDGDHAFDLHHHWDIAADAYHGGGNLEVLARTEEISRNIVTLLQESPKPIVAATRGDVREFGLGFFMAADIKLGSSQAAFTAPDQSTGLMAGWGLTHTLPHMMGQSRALAFLYSNRTVGASEAFQTGLLDRLIEDSVWEEELDNFTQRLAQIPQPAAHLTKLAVQQAAHMDLTTMLSVEWESQQQCWSSLETAEGLTAWREERAPSLHIATNLEPDE